MQLTHVLIGKSEPVGAKSGHSGINKRPQDGPIALDAYGLNGDTIVDTDHHGGLSQAVYIFGGKDYAFWEEKLQRSLNPGTFGENLILTDLSTLEVAQDDIFTIGKVVLKVTYPRIPCATLAARMNDKSFPKQFTKSGHVGVYCSVTKGGFLEPDTPAKWSKSDGKPILDLLPGYRT